MSEDKHTPGPWTNEDNHSNNGMLRLIGSNGGNGGIYLAHVMGPNCEANAHLIAAAPALKSMLEELMSVSRAANGISDEYFNRVYAKAQQAMDLANGQDG